MGLWPGSDSTTMPVLERMITESMQAVMKKSMPSTAAGTAALVVRILVINKELICANGNDTHSHAAVKSPSPHDQRMACQEPPDFVFQAQSATGGF